MLMINSPAPWPAQKADCMAVMSSMWHADPSRLLSAACHALSHPPGLPFLPTPPGRNSPAAPGDWPGGLGAMPCEAMGEVVAGIGVASSPAASSANLFVPASCRSHALGKSAKQSDESHIWFEMRHNALSCVLSSQHASALPQVRVEHY